jgi:hypothetical protein
MNTPRQRRLNSTYENVARSGAPKRTTIPAPAHGMRSRIAPSHEFLHGAPVDCEPLQKTYERDGAAPVHPGMTTQTKSNDGDAFRGKHDRSLSGKVLNEAANLGRKPAPRGEKA